MKSKSSTIKSTKNGEAPRPDDGRKKIINKGIEQIEVQEQYPTTTQNTLM